MKKTIKALALFSMMSALASCAGIDKTLTGSSPVPTVEQRTSAVAKYPSLTADQKNKFIKGEPWVGMTQEQLKDIWNNDPKKTQKKITARGNEEIQLYELRIGDWKSGVKSQFWRVNVVDGKVLELQELDGTVGSFNNL
jgi:hypothetical protein